jgi:hypothetical protein
MTRGDVLAALARLDAWIEARNFSGWDPHDALNSPLLKALTFGQRRLGQVWVQLVKRSPINLRPLLGVRPGRNPKGQGLFLASYWRKFQLGGAPHHLEQVRSLAAWLTANVTPTPHGLGWGYNFDWPNRDFFAPAGTPTIVNTAFVGLAFLDLLNDDRLPETAMSAEPIGATIRAACEFIAHDLHQTPGGADEVCFSYTPLDRRRVHNASLLGAWLLAEAATSPAMTAAGGRAPAWSELALRAARYSARRQRADGAWLYGEADNDNWVDSFHTGYVLVALNRLGKALGTSEFETTVAKGYAYWKAHFIGPGGAPRFYPDRPYPQEGHCAAQAILTLLEFAGDDAEAAELARQTAGWAIEHLQTPAGRFDDEIHGRYRIRVGYMRWTQAWMQRALTEWIACAYA